MRIIKIVAESSRQFARCPSQAGGSRRHASTRKPKPPAWGKAEGRWDLKVVEMAVGGDRNEAYLSALRRQVRYFSNAQEHSLVATNA